MPDPGTKTWNQSEGSYMEITPGKCNDKNSSDVSNIDSEEKVKVDAGVLVGSGENGSHGVTRGAGLDFAFRLLRSRSRRRTYALVLVGAGG